MILVETDWPKSRFPLPLCQPCNQFGLFTRKVTSATCISTTRDPATKRIQNSLLFALCGALHSKVS